MGPKVTNGDPDEPKTAGEDGHGKVKCQVQEAVSAAVAVVSVGVNGHGGFLSGWVANKKNEGDEHYHRTTGTLSPSHYKACNFCEVKIYTRDKNRVLKPSFIKYNA